MNTNKTSNKLWNIIYEILIYIIYLVSILLSLYLFGNIVDNKCSNIVSFLNRDNITQTEMYNFVKDNVVENPYKESRRESWNETFESNYNGVHQCDEVLGEDLRNLVKEDNWKRMLLILKDNPHLYFERINSKEY